MKSKGVTYNYCTTCGEKHFVQVTSAVTLP
jgi:hypothetical protein